MPTNSVPTFTGSLSHTFFQVLALVAIFIGFASAFLLIGYILGGYRIIGIVMVRGPLSRVFMFGKQCANPGRLFAISPQFGTVPSMYSS